ncbi:hypothetical protein ACWES4_32010, partial [Streptomyces sp. NPDC004011]
MNITNGAGFGTRCLPYAQRNTEQQAALLGTAHPPDMQRPSPGLASQCEGLTTKEAATFPMDTQNTSVRPRAESRNGGKNHPHRRTQRPHTKAHPGGVIHDNTRHTTRFTVIGNHL